MYDSRRAGSVLHMNTRHRHRAPATAGLLVLALLSTACSANVTVPRHPVWDGEHVVLPVGDGGVSIDPDTLEITYAAPGDAVRSWSAPTSTRLGVPTTPTIASGTVSWGYQGSEFTVTAEEQDGRLEMEVRSSSDQELAWPVAARDSGTRSVEFPNGEGQSIPISDDFWRSAEAGLVGTTWDFAGGLTMPFWGTTFDDSGVSYIVHDDIGTALNFGVVGDRLAAYAMHDFSGRRGTGTFGLSFAPTDGNPVAAAQDYRSRLLADGGLTTLEQKIAANPETRKLIGALHAYTWGDGRDAGIVDRLQELGIDRAWLGYDADGDPIDADTTAAAAAAGYLVGPYDSWANAQAQEDVEEGSDTTVWTGDLFPASCVLDEDGAPVTGFGGNGCYASSAAIAAEQAANGILNQRVQAFVQNGATSYFLDVDAVGQLFSDSSPSHPQTEAEDRALRLARMQALANGDFSGGRPLVLGSETAASWANPSVSYSHGSSTPLTDGIWELTRDRENWGGYWPPTRPGFFYKPTELPRNVATAMFDPRYRVPLYETVLHDSVVSTDRWEMNLYKFDGLEHTRMLTNLLYNTPSVIALDEQVLDQHGEELARMQEFFGVLQDAAGTAPMTGFERLGEQVQQTVFGDALTVTVNFGDHEEYGVGSGCARAEIPGAPARSFCPEG